VRVEGLSDSMAAQSLGVFSECFCAIRRGLSLEILELAGGDALEWLLHSPESKGSLMNSCYPRRIMFAYGVLG